jgi:adenylate cyclase
MLDRNSAFGYQALATVMIFSDRQPEAVAAAEKGMRLDPRNRDWYLFYKGFAYTYMGRYEEAIPLLSLHLTVHPNNLDAHIGLIIDYIELGREQAARVEAAEVLRINPRFSLQVRARTSPQKPLALKERNLADLRKAGLK